MLKRTNLSEEHKQKIGKANKGKICSVELRTQISESLRGRKQTKESNEKRSRALKGRVIPEEQRKRMLDGMRKTKRENPTSEETKKKMSEVKTGKPNYKGRKPRSEQAKKNISEAHKGIIQSEKQRQKVSERMKGNKYNLGKIRTEESNLKTSQTLKKKYQDGSFVSGMKGKKHTEEWKKEVSRKLKGVVRTEDYKKKMSKTHKEKWQDPEFAEKRIADFFKGNRCKPNKPEMFLKNVLEQLYPGEWRYVGDGQVFIAGKCPDFINVNGQKKIIELFGDYWHRGQDPQDRADIFKPFGFETLVIWEKELKNFKSLRRKIFNFTEI